jgi:hydroxymethylglutaryl-CoA reductase (NADPH)
MSPEIPGAKGNDYSPETLTKRQAFIEEQTGAKLNHSKQYSFDPQTMSGDIESL